MRNLLKVALIGALAAAPMAGVANAQSGQDTGAGKPSGSTTNSGTARPDATTGGAGTGGMAAPSAASPTSGSGGSGSGMARPDADSNSGKTGGVEQSPPTKAAPTDTKN